VVRYLASSAGFQAWQPSTWPKAPSKWEASLIDTLRQIFNESILNEINNVIADAGDNLQHRGHVVAIALLCALDAVSSYGYGAKSGKQIPDFISAHFSPEYHPHASKILYLYRHAMIHSWNLFEAAILPGNDSIANNHGVLCFGLLHFRNAIFKGVEDYLKQLGTDKHLQKNTLSRYRSLTSTAKN
jgi:hypothetical protein